MADIDKPGLPKATLQAMAIPMRGLLKQATWSQTEQYLAPQEMLDLLLMLGGHRPLYLAREFNPPGWSTLLVAMARRCRAKLFPGLEWMAENPFVDAPDWARETFGRLCAEQGNALYMTRSTAIADEIMKINLAGGRPTMEQEARLLGYPLCCVQDHYCRFRLLKDKIVQQYERAAGGDEAKIRQLFDEDTPVVNIGNLMHEIKVAPYTSVIMCPSCAATNNSPAMKLSHRNERFAWSTVPEIAEMVKRSAAILESGLVSAKSHNLRQQG